MEFLIFLLGAFVIEVLAGYFGIKFSNEVGAQWSNFGTNGNSETGQTGGFVFAQILGKAHKQFNLSISM